MVADVVASRLQRPQLGGGKEVAATDPTGDDKEGGDESVSLENREGVLVAVVPAIVDADDEAPGVGSAPGEQIVTERRESDRVPACRLERVHLLREETRRQDQSR